MCVRSEVWSRPEWERFSTQTFCQKVCLIIRAEAVFHLLHFRICSCKENVSWSYNGSEAGQSFLTGVHTRDACFPFSLLSLCLWTSELPLSFSSSCFSSPSSECNYTWGLHKEGQTRQEHLTAWSLNSCPITWNRLWSVPRGSSEGTALWSSSLTNAHRRRLPKRRVRNKSLFTAGLSKSGRTCGYIFLRSKEVMINEVSQRANATCINTLHSPCVCVNVNCSGASFVEWLYINLKFSR